MKFKLSCILLLFVILNLNSLDGNAGTSGFSFLKVKYSARAAALGSAFTGLADDASAVFYNPAGLVQVRDQEIQATYMNYLDGINCGSLVYVRPLSEKFTLAGFAKFLTASETRTLADASGNYLGTAGEFGVSDLLVGISVSRFINNIINLGVNIKYIRESLDDETGTAVACDISLLHQTTNKDLKIGISYQNIGTQITYFTDSEYEEKLPRILNVGFNYHPHERLYLLLDIVKPAELDYSGKIGIEYGIYEQFCLRGGYRTNSSDWRNGGDQEMLAGISLGAGFEYRSYKIDYAINSYGDLGFVNQISLSYIF